MNWHFDWNEGFMIITSIIGLSITLFLRKHFHKLVFIYIWLYSVAFIETVDYSLAGSPFQVYYCADNFTYEPVAALIHIFLYPSFSFLFLFFYNRWNLSGKKLLYYILGWDAFGVFFEWLNVKNGVFTYTRWNMYNSFFVYPISCLLLLWVYHFIKNQLKNPMPN